MDSQDYLYHYTSINTLGFILKNRNIRFNNLCALDELDEGIHADAKWGKYCFVSSWTEIEKESIEMWKMYSNDMNGVRIKLRKYPFKEYDIQIITNSLLDQKETVKSLLGEEEVYNNEYTFVSYRQSDILHKVEYNDINTVDNIKAANPFSRDEGTFSLDMGKIGVMKNEYWSFQREWRYMLLVVPFPMHLNSENSRIFNEKIKILDKLPELPFSDYYLTIDDKAFSEMEIMIGPKANDIDIKIVDLLVKEYNPSAKMEVSCLRNRIR